MDNRYHGVRRTSENNTYSQIRKGLVKQTNRRRNIQNPQDVKRIERGTES